MDLLPPLLFNNALALSFIQQEMDETIMCKVEKNTTSKDTWKILEEEFGARGSDMQQ